ncbi:MAG: ABC transporter permease [Ornithinimicrobium sp.]|uniref:ABC transporter permease n=1 Tax=Ornithinimicrobium sp. TaxID=1977084 RepID=UPI0017F7EB6F|nr:ABC transporter permease [Actinomycetota bacterium]
MTLLGGPDHQGSVPGPDQADAAALAQQHGLDLVGVRPPLGAYLRDLWRHRSFLLTMASADFISRHQQSFLGQIWLLLNPLLQGGAYYLIFGGIILDTRRGAEGNYIGFLLVGLFMFLFIASGINNGAKALTGNMGLVRALRFPRVILPIAVTLTELFAALPAFAVALLVVVLTGEQPTWAWLLYPVAILIAFVMTCGISMLAARLVYVVRDLANLVPLITRVLRYTSGVFFVISANATGWLGLVLMYQPVAAALSIIREPVLREFPLDGSIWAVATGWAVLFFVSGLVVFWRGEATYGRQ